ncbi:MAG: TonB-dependent receptor [Bacteroidia bacterium]|nr:TonB-dependent receptor [Bacteroidia bacterium]
MKNLIYSIFLLLFSSNLFAQNNCSLRLEGYLAFASDSFPIENAELFVENIHLKTTSNKFGYFSFKNICSGEILLEIDLGKNIHIHHLLQINGDTQIFILIQENQLPNEAANVIGRIAKNQNQINRISILNASGKSLSEQLEQIPGIRTLQTGSSIGKPISQGMTGLRLPIFVNGNKQEGQQWGNEHGPEIDPLGYSSISITKGALTLQKTHDALGGIVEINNRFEAHEGELDVLNGYGYSSNNRLIHSFFRLSNRKWKTQNQWYLNGSFRRGGNYKAPEYYLKNTGLFEAAMNIGFEKVKQHATQKLILSGYYFEGGIFSGSSIGNTSDLLAALQRTMPLYGKGNFSYTINAPRQTVSHFQSNYESNQTNKRFQLSGQLDNRREYDFHRNSTTTFPQLDLYLFTLNANQDFNTKWLHNPKFQWGWSQSIMLNQYAGYFFIPDMKSSSTGTYLTYKKHFFNWQFLASIRSDFKYLTSSWKNKGKENTDTRYFFNTSGAISLNKTHKNQTTEIHLSRLWRAPWINELYSNGVHHGSAAFEIGNSSLGMETDYKLEFSWSKNTPKSQLFLQAFTSYIFNYINLSPTVEPVLTVRGAFPGYEYKQFDVFFSGADIQYKLKIFEHIQWQNTATFIYAKDIKTNTFPAYVPPAQWTSALEYTKNNFVAKSIFQHTFHQSFYTPNTDYLPPPSSYSLLHFHVGLNQLGGKQKINLSIEIQNLLDTEYRNYLDRFRYFAAMPGRNIQVRFVYNFHHHNEEKSN